MEHWKTIDLSNFFSVPVRNRQIVYDDNIYTLDFETTSIYFDGQQYTTFDYDKDPLYYQPLQKYGILYIWQFSYNDKVIYGRTLDELLEFLTALRKRAIGRIIIYIHNLAYEFQFLRNIIHDFKVFARKPRHPIKAYSESLNMEFRCSLMLTNMSLAKLSKALNLPVEKQTGLLDYNKLRLPCTDLFPDELKYCEYDCIVLYYVILKYKQEYDHVFNIPLTQTGKLRRVVKKKYAGNTRYYKRLSEMLPTTYAEFNTLCLAYSGGYTHANALYTSQVLDTVYSMDIASSYPTVMVSELFPMSKFVKTRITSLDQLSDKNAYIVDITFTDIKAVCSCVYLSKSKAVKLYDCIEDNGRVVTSKMARYVLTDIDLKIVHQVYKFDYTINEVYVAYKERLDTTYVQYVLQLYADKTVFKGVADKSDLYMQSKEYINSLYGMCVTNTIRDEVEFGDDWSVKPLTVDDAESKLISLTQKHRTFLNYAWGVWVTAYARYNLWSVMLQMSDDVVYCDTDSIKFVNKDNFKYFEAYNKTIVEKLTKAVEYHGLDKELINPIDSKGKHRPLGVYDYEGAYEKFVTLGAKKYADLKDDELEITVSGVSKKGVSILGGDIYKFKDGLTFDYEHSGRMILSYNDNQPEMTLIDYTGKEYHVIQPYGINMMPTTYTLGLSVSYEDYLISLAGQSSTHMSLITGKEDLPK